MSVTVDSFTSFAPDRDWSFPIWGAAISRCGFPISKAVFCDNTGKDSGDQIRVQIPGAFTPVGDRYPVRFDKLSGGLRSWHFANIWNKYIPKFTGDYVLSIEDDVLPEPGFLKRMVESLQDTKVGVVGLAVKCRHKSAHLMVYRCTSIDPFILDRKNLVRERSGKVEVDSVSTSCCLFRREFLDGFQFQSSPNEAPKGGWGHEWSLMKKIRKAGYKVLCDFDIKVWHYQSPTEFVQI